MPFGEEERQLVILAIGESKAVQLDDLLDCAVDATEVDHQLAVDKDEHIIVAAEGEGLRSFGVVGELRQQFEGEVEVSVWCAAWVSEELILNREEPSERDALGIRV